MLPYVYTHAIHMLPYVYTCCRAYCSSPMRVNLARTAAGASPGVLLLLLLMMMMLLLLTDMLVAAAFSVAAVFAAVFAGGGGGGGGLGTGCGRRPVTNRCGPSWPSGRVQP